eukprot:8868863-Prorocentrum_lima.AAC.1
MVEPDGLRGSGPKQVPEETDEATAAAEVDQTTNTTGDTTTLAIPTPQPAASTWTITPPTASM